MHPAVHPGETVASARDFAPMDPSAFEPRRRGTRPGRFHQSHHSFRSANPMSFDLQQDGWPGDDQARDEFQEIRASLISGLVRLASAEEVPQAMVKDQSEELTDEGRRSSSKTPSPI